MTLVQVEQYIPAHVRVGHGLVTLAKVFVLEKLTEDVAELTSAWLSHMDAPMPSQVVVHSDVDPLPIVTQAADSISCHLALYEAIWGLIHANVIFPCSSDLQVVTPTVGYTTVVQRSSGYSGGWAFEQFTAAVPRQLWRAPSWTSNKYQPLSDGSLFLHELGIANLDPMVEESLREAVTCFCQDLYTPCLAMLARAVEGAWTAMGLAIAGAAQVRHPARAMALTRELLDPQYSLSRRLARVADVYDQQDLSEPIWNASGVKPRGLRQVALWADQVRDSRNVLHVQSQPAMANTYEKVAALLIGAVPAVRTMYAVQTAALQVAEQLRSASDALPEG